jgi:hypothetical protein
MLTDKDLLESYKGRMRSLRGIGEQPSRFNTKQVTRSFGMVEKTMACSILRTQTLRSLFRSWQLSQCYCLLKEESNCAEVSSKVLQESREETKAPKGISIYICRTSRTRGRLYYF